MSRNGKIITALLVITFLFVTVGFCAYSSDLSITDIAATVRPALNIRITDFHVISNTNGGFSNADEYNARNAMTDITLPENGTITYVVEITNFSDAYGILEDIVGLPSNLKYEIDVGETNPYQLGDVICNNGECGTGTDNFL